MDRRKFLKSTGLASSSLMVPSFLKAFSSHSKLSSRSGKILVIVQLSGGNDGLNTIVPYRNDIYFKLRPSLALKENEILKVDSEQAFNKALAPLQSLYEDGLMSIINSVGYPNPDRSHFRSMDIWHTASASNEYLNTGWIGRYLDSNCSDCDTNYHALEVDDSLSFAMKGIEHAGFAMRNPRQLRRTTENKFLQTIGEHAAPQKEENIAYLYKTMIDTQASANYLYQQSKVHKSKISYPKNKFAKDLKQVAELITADTDTKIYYVSMSGFDTHAYQRNKQDRLLKNYAEAMAAFVKDLQSNGLLDDTLIMTFSEFGRRVKQNASKGTDHGTANNVFLMGGQLKKKGFFNVAPKLENLDNGDLIFDIDFRRIYATILEAWLKVDATPILGKTFDKLVI